MIPKLQNILKTNRRFVHISNEIAFNKIFEIQ